VAVPGIDSPPPDGRSIQMLDLILLALGLGFFVLTIGYAYACDGL
jgi:hypothetical protein